MNPKEHPCKGCHRKVNNTCALLCRDLHVNIYQDVYRGPKNCPCMICIIKGVCNDPCDNRCEFWSKEYHRIWSMPTKKITIQPIIRIPIHRVIKDWLYSGIVAGW